MKKIVLLLLAFFTNSFIWAGSKPIDNFRRSDGDPIKKIVREIAKSNVYEISTTVGYSGTPSQQAIRYQQLLKSATIAQLTELATTHKNAIVRLYAFCALVNKSRDVPQTVINQFRNDKTIIAVLNGDIAENTPMNIMAERCLY
jgi:hypothetical protein